MSTECTVNGHIFISWHRAPRLLLLLLFVYLFINYFPPPSHTCRFVKYTTPNANIVSNHPPCVRYVENKKKKNDNNFCFNSTPHYSCVIIICATCTSLVPAIESNIFFFPPEIYLLLPRKTTKRNLFLDAEREREKTGNNSYFLVY